MVICIEQLGPSSWLGDQNQALWSISRMVGLSQSRDLYWWPEMCLVVYFEDLVLSPTITEHQYA